MGSAMPQLYDVVLTKRARRDLIDIGDYIAYTLSVPAVALDFVEDMMNSIMALNKMPERYALVNDEVLAERGIRCMPYKNYYVFYKVLHSNYCVNVLRIGYNRKNWKEILRGGIE